ncbi:MAG: L,D-transpeptidase family protein [Chloroflexi bacterium]|nr:L,D-transpeptidase family protein [Chloroflexota bacterium]
MDLSTRTIRLPAASGTRDGQEERARRRRIAWWLLCIGLALGVAIIVISAALVFGSPQLTASMPRGTTEVSLDSTIRVTAQGWSAYVDSASLWMTPLAPASGVEASEVQIQVQAISEPWPPGQTVLLVLPAEGALRPDAAYRLTVQASALPIPLPWLAATPLEEQIRFTTQPSPRPLANETVELKTWGAPLAIRWSLPLEDLQYEVTPPVESRAWIDGAEPNVAYILIEEPEASQYRITMTDARATNGVHLQQPADFTMVPPAQPKPLDTEEPLPIRLGAPFEIRWNVPLQHIAYQISPETTATWEIDQGDATTVRLRLDGLRQGTEYRLEVLDAVAASGAPLAEPTTIRLVTPPALQPPTLQTGTGASWAPISARPTIAFNTPIADRAAAVAAISVEPAVPGSFQWLDDRRVQFVPSQSWPFDRLVTFRVQPGPGHASSASGSYLEKAAVLSFRTEPRKIIDVDISDQRLTLIEGDQSVRSFLVASGIPGADTPLGEYRVLYKMPTAHFTGVNEIANVEYDLPDVKWVLPFMGDYTIHGAYWRETFGRPGSNGCVSLSDDDAKVVYDWAPVGTTVRIHE